MAQVEHVVLECDLCGVEGPQDGPGVHEHSLAFDGRAARIVDACEECWVPYRGMLERLSDAGRSAKRSGSRRNRVVRVSS